MKRLSPQFKQAGVTLTELLVVLVIISVLSTIALPVYINQAERARIGAAQQETAELAKAEEQCGITHGLYVPLYLLNNLPGRRGGTGGQQGSNADTIQDISNATAFDFNIPSALLASSGDIQFSNTSDPRIRRLKDTWTGPFINYQRVYDNNADQFDLNQTDYPLDPWGNPYRLYSPVGITGTTSVGPNFSTTDFNNLSSTDDRFDRWAVVSFGPNGISDTSGAFTTTNQDDIFFVFGSARAETVYSSTIINP